MISAAMLVRTGQILACYGVQNASSPAWCMGGGAGCHAYPVNWFTGWLHGVGSGEQRLLVQVLAGLRLHADVSCRGVCVPGNADTIINQSVFNATQRWGLRMAAALNESYGMPPPCTIGEGARPGLGEYFFCRAPNRCPSAAVHRALHCTHAC